MNNLKLRCDANNVTLIPNDFIDYYLPDANGDFVKVYLCLFRAASSGRNSALSDIADILNCTDRDVIRALRYWGKAGLIVLETDADGVITGVIFHSGKENKDAASDVDDAGHQTVLTETTLSAVTEQSTDVDLGQNEPVYKNTDIIGLGTSEVSRDIPRCNTSDTVALSAKEQTVENKNGTINTTPSSERKQMTAEKLSKLAEDEEFTCLLFVAGKYLGRVLTRQDVDTFGYFYDELHMSAELIEYLIEYCVSRNNVKISYIKKVGLSWHEKGIKSVKDVKEADQKRKDYYAILKALGNNSHALTETEIQCMDVWIDTYGFTFEMIKAACAKAVMQTVKPSLNYVNKILTSWHENNIRTLADVEREDEVRCQEQKSQKKRKTSSSKKKPSGTFYNFEQRDYSGIPELEKRLLGY